jgi:hypothetical protein
MQMSIENPIGPRRFTVDEFFEMGRHGMFEEDGRVELLDGEILVMPPTGPEHNSSAMRFDYALRDRLRGVALVMTASNATLSKYSAPSPDLMVLRPRDDFYAHANPQPDDILALVEVSSSSLRRDRGRKLRLYARHDVREYWIVDVAGRRIERCRYPVGDLYGERILFGHGQTIAFEAFPDRTFEVDELIGPPL